MIILLICLSSIGKTDTVTGILVEMVTRDFDGEITKQLFIDDIPLVFSTGKDKIEAGVLKEKLRDKIPLKKKITLKGFYTEINSAKVFYIRTKQ